VDDVGAGRYALSFVDGSRVRMNDTPVGGHSIWCLHRAFSHEVLCGDARPAEFRWVTTMLRELEEENQFERPSSAYS